MRNALVCVAWCCATLAGCHVQDATPPDTATDASANPTADAHFDVPTPPFVCDPAHPKPWIAWVIEHFSDLSDPAAGPPPQDPVTCAAIIQRGCETVCDCKFAMETRETCGLVGATFSQPWMIWLNGSYYPHLGKCGPLLCTGMPSPGLSPHSLVCYQHQCYAVGKFSLDTLPAEATSTGTGK